MQDLDHANSDTAELQIDSTRLLDELKTLATFTSIEPSADGTAVTRIVFTPDDLRARAWLKDLAAAEGLAIREDAVGNTFFRWLGTEPDLPAVATGSHIDAIPHAGMYDGTVGVLGGLEAIRALKRSGLRPRRSIELVMLTSEEPTRFGIGCLGSRLLSGTLDPDPRRRPPRRATRPPKPQTLAQVRTAAGFTGPLSTVRLPHEPLPRLGRAPHRAGPPARARRHPHRHRHQHRRARQLPLHHHRPRRPRRRAPHARPPRRPLRRRRTHPLHRKTRPRHRRIDTVATVGTCDVYPGAVNSVPSRVTLQLDIRDTDPARRESVMQAVRARLSTTSRQRREVTITEDAGQRRRPRPIARRTSSQLLDEICARATASPSKKMVSRAYHDSSSWPRIAPIAMIFIPCRNGVSHRPDEYAAPADIAPRHPRPRRRPC